MLDSIDYWLFHDEFTVIQAALLIVGADPSNSQEWVLDQDPQNRAEGFNAVFSAITKAINSKKLKATIRYDEYQYYPDLDGEAADALLLNGYCIDHAERAEMNDKHKRPDWKFTTVEVHDLKNWLLSRNFKPAFFFSETAGTPNYLNKEHPRYSAKLAAAVNVWLAMEDDNLLAGKATKAAITNWLEARYRELDLVYDGKPNTNGIAECTNVANWNSKGGATKTPIS